MASFVSLILVYYVFKFAWFIISSFIKFIVKFICVIDDKPNNIGLAQIKENTCDVKKYQSTSHQNELKLLITKKNESYEEFRQKIYLNECYSNILLQYLEHRKIKYLIHFTDVRNIESILTYGLRPITKLNGFNYEHCDEERLDGMLDCISLSVEFPNQKYFYSVKQRFPNRTFCIIRLNAIKTLIDNKFKKYFFFTNAANSIFTGKHSEYYRIRYFEKMFEGKCLRSYLPRDVQSEILFEGIILPYCIDKIYFCNDLDYNIAKKYISHECFNNNNELFEVKDFYFNNRYGNVYWRKR